VLATLAQPAAAQAACPQESVSRTFLPWLDPALYQAAPDGGFEAGAAGWTLSGGAAVAEGNEPYFVGSAADVRSLALPAGSAATTPPICIGIEHPTIRFFARNTGSPTSTLGVQVVLGERLAVPIGVVSGSGEWAPTLPLPVLANLLGERDVAFRFAPADRRGEWTIDDVYVDPYGKG
jgi:hypothetical protein